MVAHGTIAFDTLTTSDQVNTGTEKSIDTSYIFNGVAKVWVDYSGSGTTYNDSFNSSSATDNGTGDYTFTLTNSMGSTSYSGITDALNTDNNNFDCFMHTQAASSFSARLRVGDSGSDTDKETYGVAHGDLA